MKNVLNGKWLITGGTSGLGLALTRQLVAHGAEVAVVARGEQKLAALRAELPRVHTIRGDIGDKNQIHRIYAEAIGALGEINGLIHCASELGHVPLRLLLDTDCEALQRTLDANLLGPFRLTKLTAPAMALANRGVVVFISSDAAVNAYPRWGAYGVSKAAQDQLAKTFAAELPESGVHFLALDPGDMDTPLHEAAVPDADRASLHSAESSARLLLAQIADRVFTPVRRSLR